MEVDLCVNKYDNYGTPVFICAQMLRTVEHARKVAWSPLLRLPLLSDHPQGVVGLCGLSSCQPRHEAPKCQISSLNFIPLLQVLGFGFMHWQSFI